MTRGVYVIIYKNTNMQAAFAHSQTKPTRKPHTHTHTLNTHGVHVRRNKKTYQVQIQQSLDTNTIPRNYEPAKALFTYLLMKLIAR